MKRHESLIPLSREHHDGLILAQLMKKDAPPYRNMPTTTADKLTYAIRFYKQELVNHFSKEEQLLEKVRNVNESIAVLATEISNEHTELSRLFTELNNKSNPEAALNELGILLEVHIRKEERILFPLIEQHCSKETMEVLRPLFT